MTTCFLACTSSSLTDTAKLADVVLPATMFLEHDDITRAGGHQYLIPGPKLVEAAGRPAHQPLRDRGARPKRLGVAEMAGLRAERGRAYRPDASTKQTAASSGSRRSASSTCSPISKRLTTSTAFGHRDGKFRSSVRSGRGPWCRTCRRHRWASRGPHERACPSSPIMSN